MSWGLWWPRLLLAAAVGVGMIPTDAPALAVVMTFAAVALAVAAIEAAYRHALGQLERQVTIWHRRWQEEHDNFQQWIRAELDREAKKKTSG